MKHKGLRLGALFCAAAMTITTSAQALSVEEAYDILRRSYVDRLPRAAKDAESLDELFSYTDNYTCYMTEEEYQTFLSSVEGEVSFAGIGAEITYAPEGISIVSVLKGGGAEKAGLKAGDMIIAIEGESCAPGSEEQRARLVGEAGTQVRVTVRHTDGSEEDYAITRAAVVQANTTVSAADGVGYIDCDSFGTQTGTYFQDGVRKYDSAVRTWIVDLRGNSGGLTSAAVTALGTFSGAGELVYFVDQSGESSAQRYDGKDLTDKPAIVLMDSGSASASEIFAGGILGTSSGIVIGTRSYGKGVAQVLFDESNCPYLHGDAVKVTAYRFYCAGGNTTDRIGVIPTLFLPQALDLYWLADGYFTDVAKESWYAPSVNAMAAIGLVSGVGGGKFDPNATMTQEEFITVLGNLVEFVNLDARAFLDKKPLAILQPLPKYRNRGFSPWAIRGVEVLTNSVFDEDGNAVNLYCTAFEDIKPKAPILREQAAAALCRALRTTGVIED